MRDLQSFRRLVIDSARAARGFVALAALAASVNSHATDAAGRRTPCSKVDAGYVLDGSVRGLFGSTSSANACVDVLRARNDSQRRLRIFIDGKPVLSNDAVAMGPSDGGVDGDPFQPLEISRGSLVVRNVGGGGPLHWTETWHLTIRDGRWIVAGWDEQASDSHRAADGGGEFHTSINALTGDVHDSYDPPDDDALAKRPMRRSCKLPSEWLSPSLAQVAAIRDRSWHCDTTLGKVLGSGG
jgi:hypothetical protein